MSQLLSVLPALAVGVGGVMVLFWALNKAVERLPERLERTLKPYVFVGPALFVVGLFLLFPAIDTFRRSFMDARSVSFVGFDNYQSVLGDRSVREAILNNVLWIIFVPAVSVSIGLAVAVLADKLKPRWENVSKSLIFLPMAISFVGASTIWGFVYTTRPEGRPQIGLLNQIIVWLGGSPVAWLQTQPINNFMLMIVFIWLQAGFAMVLLSAALKNVPEETLEAARIDGANEVQIFFRVIVPQIFSTIVVVFTTVLIGVLKVFDIVRVMTNGNFGTEVVANRFVSEIFTFRQFGRAAAIVVFLMLATIPIMIVNIRKFREQEAVR
jgi:alpha-glucoside transport system permease protein